MTENTGYTGKKEILLAENSGFCFGVRQAIEKTEAEIKKKKEGGSKGRIYTWGPLIHNRTVTDDLREKRGVHSVLAGLRRERGCPRRALPWGDKAVL